MLVLTRKTNQQIQIGENVVITILHVKGQSVRVGIEAPRQVRVVRSEIAESPKETIEAEASMPPPANSESSEAEMPSLPETGTRRIKSPANVATVCVPAPRRTPTGRFSSPLAERVTAVVESSGGEASTVNPFAARPFSGGQHGQPHGYHFQVERCSALTTHPSGQRP